MKLIPTTYSCGRCGSVFEVGELDPTTYGEFLLRSSTGFVSYLNALDDKTYDEVDRYLLKLPESTALSPTKRARLLHAIYGAVACDPAPDGTKFDMLGLPRCPVCDHSDQLSWEFNISKKPIDVDVPAVTHRIWQSYSDQSKQDAVKKELELLFSSNKNWMPTRRASPT